MCQCRTSNSQCLLVKRTHPAPTLQQSQSLLVTLGLPEWLSTVSRQNPYSQRAPVKLGLPGPQQVARPAQPQQQQWQSLLMKIGLPGLKSAVPRRNQTSCLLGEWSRVL